MVLRERNVINAYHEYVVNDMPARLIFVPEMRLVDRNFVAAHFRGHIVRNMKKLAKIEPRDIRETLRDMVRYAIFSHRWLPAGEPAFQQMSTTLSMEGPGWEKLKRFCKEAELYGCVLAWSDTCCIDKSSSAELDEAIRSMFKWYQNSSICITHLADSTSVSDMRNDEWLTRGWTLQELMAPRSLKFFGKNWDPLSDWGNDKDNESMLKSISSITKIPSNLVKSYTPSTFGAAQVLSWASGRKTTRVEDIAYSLIGLLDVSLNIAYGEGGKSFYRLMQAVIQESDDCRIFRWMGEPSRYNIALPSAPSCYPLMSLGPDYRPNNVVSCGDNSSFSMSNGRLQMKVILVPIVVKLLEAERHRVTYAARHGTIEDVTILLPLSTMRINAAHHFLGIINYSKDIPTRSAFAGSKRGSLQKGRTYFGYLLEENWEPESIEKMETDNVVEVIAIKSVVEDTTTIRLSNGSM
jgi:hypothetical protein